ncbi:MAG: BatA domain-containing protein [Bacteroidetes bacterium]|nr:BatA domain-containing protein [Bacteroidota bacterium]
MNFAYPSFLAALLVLAIPVIIHLFHFRRYKTIRFSNVRFLRNMEMDRKNRNRIKHLLVLTARCLALASLVLAFTLPSCNSQKEISGKKSVRIYLDNSFSMEQRNTDGILFETAKEKAREIIQSYQNEADFQIISNDLSSVIPHYQSAPEALNTIDKIQISPRSESYAKVWKWLQNHQPDGGNPIQLFYCISDYQKAFLNESENIKPSEKLRAFGVRIQASGNSNFSLDSAWLQNPFALAGEKNKLLFRVTNFSNENAEALNIKLTIAGSTAALSKISVEKQKSNVGSIEFSMPNAGSEQAKLELEDASAPFDNVLFLSLYSRGNVKILLDGANNYLQSALRTNIFFKTESGSANTVRFPNFQVLYKVVIQPITEQEAAGILAFTESGGKVILIPGENMGMNALSGLSGSFGIPKIKEKKSQKIQMQKTGLSNPFFNQVFQSTPANMEMPAVLNYYSTAGSNGNGDNILSLENGDPFLLHFKKNTGDLYWFTSAFSQTAGNFVQSVLFFPVISNTAMNNQVQGNIYGEVASSKGYLLHQRFENSDGKVVLEHGREELVPEIQNGIYGQELFISPLQNQSGYYRLVHKSNQNKEVIALNDSRKESNPAISTDTELELLQKQAGIQWLSPEMSLSAGINKTGESGIWRLFIWLAAAFFALEVLLLVFFDRVTGLFQKNIQTSTP